jgi:hypothetical protein
MDMLTGGGLFCITGSLTTAAIDKGFRALVMVLDSS